VDLIYTPGTKWIYFTHPPRSGSTFHNHHEVDLLYTTTMKWIYFTHPPRTGSTLHNHYEKLGETHIEKIDKSKLNV